MWLVWRIEQNKGRYYEVLEQSSHRWHEGKHDPRPAVNFLLFILTQACKEFEHRVGQFKSTRGEKTEAILAAVERQVTSFRSADVRAGCPGVGVDLVRQVLARLKKQKKIKPLGTGRPARWEKTGNQISTRKLRNKPRIGTQLTHAPADLGRVY